MAAFWKIAVQSACDMFSQYKYLNVILDFPPLFWSGNFFLTATFPDHCLLNFIQISLNMHRCFNNHNNHGPRVEDNPVVWI